MASQRTSWIIVAAKLGAIAGFLMLVLGTYLLRAEVLVLSEIRFSADNVRVANELERLEESFPRQVEDYEMSLKQHDLQMEHYRMMLDLYENDYDEYVKRIEDKYELPRRPSAPQKPRSPDVAKELFEINAEFRSEKYEYFQQAIWLNRMAMVAATLLVGSLVFLLMFDADSPRWIYLVALVVSFVFLIGPSFHSILTGLIGVMDPPSVR